MTRSRSSAWILIVVLPAGLATSQGADVEPVAFREIRPILADNCFACHGPDAASRESSLRLDRREDALTAPNGGHTAIVPGDPDSSELIFRVSVDDETLRMPPPSTGKRLTPAQVALLTRWIEQGAPWEEHWSFRPPTRPSLPKVHDTAWPRNPIDLFILTRLEAETISPSPEADRRTLIRRLSFDLTGLPPTPEDVRAFVLDPAPDAYERLVERLLAGPHYGERMAVHWLDLVRFADTVGYHSDVPRSIALYRDYVIRSFNENLPFDQFTIEQLAGDLLPEATAWQKVASAYNMLGMTTEEGGAQAREYLARYAADRVRNAGSVWMGATLGCAECHDHKYDPYTTRDFYAFAAFFADLQQEGVGTPKPTLEMPSEFQAAELRRLDHEIASLERSLETRPANQTEGDDPRIAQRDRWKAEQDALRAAIRRTIVARSGEPRITRILHRGDWMDETGDVVEPAAPAFMKPVEPVGTRRPTRLELAQWLVAADPPHPQTARVVVNRLWRLVFGAGLSETPDDLGTQGEWPTHPELLDWLAVEFIDSGWDVKHMIRLMVTSTTYRQSSHPRPDLTALDPANRRLGRQGSFRLEAEMIRDSALTVAGLIAHRIGGESVRPYQPAGHWRFLNFPKRDYVPSLGPDQYRRGLYTHWQRTLLHPSLMAFDAPSREQCTAKRPISNTPQAALALLNDPTYVEVAVSLAERVLAEDQPDDESRISAMFALTLQRTPTAEEQSLLVDLLAKHRELYGQDPGATEPLLASGRKRERPPDSDPIEHAAWTSLARVLLNLDEFITRE